MISARYNQTTTSSFTSASREPMTLTATPFAPRSSVVVATFTSAENSQLKKEDMDYCQPPVRPEIGYNVIAAWAKTHHELGSSSAIIIPRIDLACCGGYRLNDSHVPTHTRHLLCPQLNLDSLALWKSKHKHLTAKTAKSQSCASNS